jgi:hypothetical protein
VTLPELPSPRSGESADVAAAGGPELEPAGGGVVVEVVVTVVVEPSGPVVVTV